MRIKNKVYKIRIKVLGLIRVTINCIYYNGGHRCPIKSPHIPASLYSLSYLSFYICWLYANISVYLIALYFIFLSL